METPIFGDLINEILEVSRSEPKLVSPILMCAIPEIPD
jgi:hypothetical protein